MATYVRNPETGQVVKATGNLTWLWQLLFSPLHFAYHRAWLYVTISFIAALATVSLSNIIFACIGASMIRRQYLAKNWKIVPNDLVEQANAAYSARSTTTAEELMN